MVSLAELAALGAGGCATTAALFLLSGLRGTTRAVVPVAVPASPWRLLAQRFWSLGGDAAYSGTDRRRRLVGWSVAGIVVWAGTGWPVAGVAVAMGGLWLPWLLGSARVVRQRLDKVEALERWCRRMADTLAGGGSVGLAQAIATTAPRVDQPIEAAVNALALSISGTTRGRADIDQATALREFADAVDDRTGDVVAAALLLALHQQSSGIAHVLRQLADGIARDVRARRGIEAARAESRQSLRILLIIQAALLAFIASVPTYAAAYESPSGQMIMSVLLGGTAALLVWMRRLSLGRPAPRFFGSLPSEQGTT